MPVEMFEDITYELTEKEYEIMPVVIKAFSQRTVKNPIKAPEIVKGLNSYLANNGHSLKMTQPRLRKMVNHIRRYSILPLMATPNGYYISPSDADTLTQARSLRNRAESILNSARGLEMFVQMKNQIDIEL